MGEASIKLVTLRQGLSRCSFLALDRWPSKAPSPSPSRSPAPSPSRSPAQTPPLPDVIPTCTPKPSLRNVPQLRKKVRNKKKLKKVRNKKVKKQKKVRNKKRKKLRSSAT